MKRTVYVILLLLAGMMPTTMQADNLNFYTQGDTTIIVNGADTARFVGNIAQWGVNIARSLDDTLVDLSEDRIGQLFDKKDEGRSDVDLEQMNLAKEISGQWAVTLRDATIYIVVGVCGIVLLSLLFSYLKRRRYYRTIEQAIAAGYQLPPSFWGTVPVQQASTTYVQQPPVFRPQQAAQVVPDGQPLATPQQPATQPRLGMVPQAMSGLGLRGPIDWRVFSSAYKWIVLGLVAMVFFAVNGSWSMVALSSVLLLIGVGKAFVALSEHQYAMMHQVPPLPPTPDEGAASPEQQPNQPSETTDQPNA